MSENAKPFKNETEINLQSLTPSTSPSPEPIPTFTPEIGTAVSAAVSPSLSLWHLKTAIMLCITTSFSGFIFGWDVGTIGGISNMMSFRNCFAHLNPQTGLHEFSPIVVGLIISVFNAGCAIGGLSIPKLCDSKGRRFGIAISVVIYLAGNIVQLTSVLSQSWIQILVGRIVTGLAIGSTSVLTPMFISESSPLKIRGAMVVFYQLMITLGILLGNVTNFASKRCYEGSNTEWMIPIGLCFVWSVMILVGLMFMPESPVFLIDVKNDRAGAVESIAKLNNLSKDDSYVTRQADEIAETSNRIKQNIGDVKWNEFLIGKPKLFLRLVIGMIIMFFQQFSGANYFFYYGTSLFNSVGLEDSYVTAIILGVVNFFSTFGGVYFVERFGRKSCLLMGSVGMFTCMVIYSSLGSFALLDNTGAEKVSVGSVMIFFTCIYIFFFATTWGPVSFVVVSELYPVRVRATSMSIATCINWVANFMISLFTPFITKSIGFRYGYVFTGCLLVSAFFVALFVPETKGLNTDQIDALYSKSLDEEEETSSSSS